MNFVGNETVYLKEMEKICAYAYDHKIPLELNLLGIGENRFYPRDSFWKLVGEMGNDVVLGLDAHHVRMIDVPDVEAKAMKMVEDFKLKLIPTPLPKMK